MNGIDYTRHHVFHTRPTLERGTGISGVIDNTTQYVRRGRTDRDFIADSLATLLEDIAHDQSLEAISEEDMIVEAEMQSRLHGPADDYENCCSREWFWHFKYELPTSWTWEGMYRKPRIYDRLISPPSDNFGRSFDNWMTLGHAPRYAVRVDTPNGQPLELWMRQWELRSTQLTETTLYDLETGLISLKPLIE